MKQSRQTQPVVLRIADIARMFALSRSTIYRMRRDDPDFPKPFKLSAGTIGFLESDVMAFIDRRARDRGLVQ